MAEVQHTCPSTSGAGFWDVLAKCADGTGTDTGTVVGIVVGIVVLAGAGIGIWWLLNKRN